MNTTPDSVPSLAESSFTSSDNNDDVAKYSKKFTFQESPSNVEVSLPVLQNSNRPKVSTVSPDSTLNTPLSLVDSEFLSLGSDECLNSPSNLHQQNKAFRTSDCVDVIPILYTPGISQVGRHHVINYEKESTNVEDDNIVSEVESENDDDHSETPPKFSFCSENFLNPSGANFFHMFDISPRIWPGWSLMSPHPRSHAAHRQEREIKDAKSSHKDLLQSSPNVLPHNTRFLWSPLESSGIDPVLEAFTPPRKSASKRSFDALDLDPGRRQLSQQFEKYANCDIHYKGSPAYSAVDSQSDVETTIVSNVDLTGTSKEWERKVDDLERSCATLKEIIRCDSKTMLQLRADIAMLRQNASVNSYNNSEKSMVLSLQTELRRVKAERDAFLDRELRHIETIAAMKGEIDEHILKKNASNEVNDSLLERALLKRQLLETKEQLRKAKEDLMVLLKENIELKSRINLIGIGHIDSRSIRKSLDWNPRGTLVLNTIAESESEETLIFEYLARNESLTKRDASDKTAECSNPVVGVNECNGKANNQTTDSNEGTNVQLCGLFRDSTQDSLEMLGECISDTVLKQFENGNSQIEEAKMPVNEVEVTLDGLIIATSPTAASFCCNQFEPMGYENISVDKSNDNRIQRTSNHSNKENIDPTSETQKPQSFLVSEQKSLCCDLCGCIPQSKRLDLYVV